MTDDRQNETNGKRVPDKKVFPVRSLEDVLASIRRTAGTGKLEINFRDGQARGDAKWRGSVVRE